MFGSDGKVYVRRRPHEEFSPQCTKKSVKGNGDSVMVWAGVSRNGTGPIHRIEGIMDQHVFVGILNDVLLPYSEDYLPLNWTLQQDNDPKHTSNLAKQWIVNQKIKILGCLRSLRISIQSKRCGMTLTRRLKQKKPTSIPSLVEVIEEAWSTVPLARCKRVIDSMPRRCDAVIKNFGYACRY
jgi:hypothetical protein